MITISTDLACILLTVLTIYILNRFYKFILFPKIVEKTTKELEKNPKWITKELHSKYYGFSDVDIILAESSIDALHRFRVAKNDKSRLEFLI